MAWFWLEDILGKVKLEGKKRMVIHFDPASERLKIAYDTHPVLWSHGRLVIGQVEHFTNFYGFAKLDHIQWTWDNLLLYLVSLKFSFEEMVQEFNENCFNSSSCNHDPAFCSHILMLEWVPNLKGFLVPWVTVGRDLIRGLL